MKRMMHMVGSHSAQTGGAQSNVSRVDAASARDAEKLAPRLRLHVDRLVLQGESAQAREKFSRALEQALAVRMQGMHFAQGMQLHLNKISAGQMKQGYTLQDIAEKVAAGVARAMETENRKRVAGNGEEERDA